MGSKHNPLFIDSTKFHGDLISAQIELKSVFVHEDEGVSVIVQPEKSGARKLAMKPTEGGNFEARVNLNHQTPVRFQFVIEKDGAAVVRSVIYAGRASYVIIEDWAPALNEDAEVLIETHVVERQAEPTPPPADRPAPTRPARAGANWAKDSSMSVASLIEKYGL